MCLLLGRYHNYTLSSSNLLFLAMAVTVVYILAMAVTVVYAVVTVVQYIVVNHAHSQSTVLIPNPGIFSLQML